MTVRRILRRKAAVPSIYQLSPVVIGPDIGVTTLQLRQLAVAQRGFGQCAAGFRRLLQASASIISDSKKHITMTRSAGFTPANQILAFQFPANIINRERQRSSDQTSPLKAHSSFCGMMAGANLVRIPPFRRSANVDGADWLTPTS
jgi:hypothetical protein